MVNVVNPRQVANDTSRPLMLGILPDILAFTGGLAVAYYLKWTTTDLVWSLWLGSLVLGYLTLLAALGSGAYVGYHLILHPDFKREWRARAALSGVALGLFILGFFSLHFGGFHAGHSVFLQQFFPITGMPEDGFGAAFTNPLLLWRLVLQHLMWPYGLFLIPAIVAERHHLFRPLMGAITTVRSRITQARPGAAAVAGQRGEGVQFIGEAMGRPYRNVIRMHLLIFFFAFAHFLKLDSFIVYAVVYVVYFFPWGEVRRRRALRKPGNTQG